jgi:import inner membrane translocase subunit TIM50
MRTCVSDLSIDIAFSVAIGIFQPPDVRPIIKAYEGKNIPVEYAKREAERKQAAIEEWEREHGGVVLGSDGSSGGTSWLGKIFGGLGVGGVGSPICLWPRCWDGLADTCT